MNYFLKSAANIGFIFAVVLIAFGFQGAMAAETGYVSFTFDDGLKSTHNLAYPILEKNSCPATAYVTTDWINERVQGFMSWEDIRELQNKGGWEIGNHTANHDYLWKKKFSKKYIKRDLTRSQQSFIDHGIKKPVSFAPPYGKWSDRLMKIVKSMGFTTSRRAWAKNDYSNDLNKFNRWALESMNLKSDVPFEKVKNEIDYAKNNHRWLVFTIHNVVESNPGRDDMTTDQLQDIAEYVNYLQKRGEIKVAPVGEVFSSF